MGKAFIDPGDAISWFPQSEKPRPRSGCGGCFLHLFVSGLMSFVSMLIFESGLGRPYTYWHGTSDVQIFEGPDRIVLFVEVDLYQKRPGSLAEPPYVHGPVELLRIDVFPDGRVKRTNLQYKGEVYFSTNLGPIIRGRDNFYVVDDPFRSRSKRLYRIGDGRIESLSPEESTKLLERAGLEGGAENQDELDKATELNGWRRFNEPSYVFMSWDKGFESARHNLRIQRAFFGASQRIHVESLSDDHPWSKGVEVVNSRRWKSYRDLLP